MMMPERKYSAVNSYRYGFNGKENDNEVKEIEGSQQDYGMRIYDPRIGKFLSVDPFVREYPWNSPYSYSEGDPINYIDLDGGEQNFTRATLPRPSGIRITNTRNLGPTTRPWFASAPISPANPGPIPPNAGVARVNGGWYFATPNGGYYRWDSPQPMTQVEREKLRQEVENTRILNSIITNAYSEKETQGPLITIDTEPKRITNDVKNLKGSEIIELRKRLEKGTATEQDKVHMAQLVKDRIAYEINDKHNPNKPAGGANASIIPDNHEVLWDQRTTYDPDTDTWWSFEGKGKKAVFHQFKGDGNGTYHWAGSTGTNRNRKGREVNPVDITKVPSTTKKKAGYTKG